MTAQRAILEVLNLTDGYLLPVTTLRSDVSRMLGREISLTDLNNDLNRLESMRQVVVIEDQEQVRQCKITANGKARIAS